MATKNKPKGPNLNQLDEIKITLSGKQISISLPAGNNFDIPASQGKLPDNINIYERADSGHLIHEHSVLTERHYRYKGFLGTNLGSMSVCLQLSHVNNPKNHLFNSEDFIQDLKEHHTNIHTERNKTADQSCQILPPESYTKSRINNIDFLHYQIEEMQSSLIRSYYSSVISDDFYITLMFKHHTIRQPIEPWYELSQALEKKIISSVQICLCGNAQPLRESLA